MSYTVLVIDDSQTIRTVVQMALQGAGHRVLASDSAAGGIRTAKAELPDLILLDYLLPDHNGDEVCRLLASDPTTAAMRILVLSAKGDELRSRAAAWPGVVGVMTKPFTSLALLARVSELLGSSGEAWTFDEQNGVAQAVFQALKPALREIPGWETARAGTQASTFYAQRLLTPATIAGLMTAITPVMTGLLQRRVSNEAPALSGSLARMPLIDVVRMLEVTGRAGRLEVLVDGGRSVIHFDRGRINGVAAAPEQERSTLREAFPGVSEAMLAEAIKQVAATGIPAAAALASNPLLPVPFERLRAHLRSAGEQELARIWDLHGTFVFVPGPPAEQLARCEVMINPAQIALTRLRAVDDLAQIEAHAGRLDVVYERSPGTAAQIARLALSDDERQVMTLIDGVRDTAAVVKAVGLGLLPVLRILFRFTRLNLISVSTVRAGETALVVIAAAGEVGEGRLGEALAHAWSKAGRGPSQVLESATAPLDTEAGSRLAAVVIEIDCDSDPTNDARRLRQRLPLGVPLVALCLTEPTASNPWQAVFDGLLVPPLHLDDLSRLISG